MSPIYPLRLLLSFIMTCAILTFLVLFQNWNINRNYSSVASSHIRPLQKSIITNMEKYSNLSFSLCDLIEYRPLYNVSNSSFKSSNNNTNIILLVTPIWALLPFTNLLNHPPLVGILIFKYFLPGCNSFSPKDIYPLYPCVSILCWIGYVDISFQIVSIWTFFRDFLGAI